MAKKGKADLIELLYAIGNSDKASAKQRLAAADKIIELMGYRERRWTAKRKDATRLLGASKS